VIEPVDGHHPELRIHHPVFPNSALLVYPGFLFEIIAPGGWRDDLHHQVRRALHPVRAAPRETIPMHEEEVRLFDRPRPQAKNRRPIEDFSQPMRFDVAPQQKG
jgi:hypothetical protein